MDDLQFAKLHAQDNSIPEWKTEYQGFWNQHLPDDRRLIESIKRSMRETTDIILNSSTFPHNAGKTKKP